MSIRHVNIIGAGLAGSEAAWQVAKRGINVKLYEMKPKQYSPAHQLNTFAELVCSNSLRSDRLENAVGLLKEEMRQLDSLIIKCADTTRVPAGGALAVDREGFSKMVTECLLNCNNIEVINEEAVSFPEDEICIIASGPLTSDRLFCSIEKYLGHESLHFFDAAAPIITFESINTNKAYRAARYNKGTEDYINCPMNKEQYQAFYHELINAELADVKNFDKEIIFEGCMPIETMAKRGIDTLRFGPLKPVGLIDPTTGNVPYAVVQLRQDNSQGTLFNIVGFQTRLKWGEQKRVFSMIPGLERAEFVRYGVMHRNTYINSTKSLDNIYRLKKNQNIYFAGQITGVEGYVESASSGLIAGINAAMQALGRSPLVFPANTAMGALASYISDSYIKDFQPMNINFGIINQKDIKFKDKKRKYQEISSRALDEIKSIAKLVH